MMGQRLAMTRVFLMAPQIVSHIRVPRAGGDPDLRSAHDRLVLIWTPAFAGDAAAGEGDILVLRRAAPRNDAEKVRGSPPTHLTSAFPAKAGSQTRSRGREVRAPLSQPSPPQGGEGLSVLALSLWERVG